MDKFFWVKFHVKLLIDTDHIMRIVCKRVIIHGFSSIFSSISILWVYRKKESSSSD